MTTLKHPTQNNYKEPEMQFLARGIINSKPNSRSSHLMLENPTNCCAHPAEHVGIRGSFAN